jgi:hypothetical protein
MSKSRPIEGTYITVTTYFKFDEDANWESMRFLPCEETEPKAINFVTDFVIPFEYRKDLYHTQDAQTYLLSCMVSWNTDKLCTLKNIAKLQPLVVVEILDKLKTQIYKIESFV